MNEEDRSENKVRAKTALNLALAVRTTGLAAALGVLLAHWPAFLAVGGGTTSEPGDQLWSVVSAILQVLPSASSWVGTVLLAALAVMTGVLVGLVGAQLGLSPRAAWVASFLFTISPLTGAVFVDPAAPGYLLATMAWLGVMALEPRATPVFPWARRALQIGLVLLAISASQVAFLPVLFLVFLVWVARGQPRGKSPQWFVAGGLVVSCLPLFLGDHLPSVGYGFGLHEGLDSFLESAPQPGPPFLAALLACLGIGGELPFLLPGRVLPELSHVLGALLVLMLLICPVFSPLHRRFALRFGSLAVVLASFGVVLVAVLGPASALPTALLMPAAAGLAVLLGSLVQPRRGKPVSSTAIAALVVIGLVMLVESYSLQSAGETRQADRAFAADPGCPFAAVRWSELGAEEQGQRFDDPLRHLILNERRFLPWDLERRLGLQLSRDLEFSAGDDQALDWMREWVTQRGLQDEGELRARQLSLLVKLGRKEEALELFESSSLSLDADPDSAVAMAMAALPALDAVDDAAMEQRLVPRIEETLKQASREESSRGTEALLGLAELRMRQLRLIDAVKAAEQAQTRDPRQVRPFLILARLYLGLGELEEGLRQIEQALQLDAEDPAARFLEGRLLAVSPRRAAEGARRMLDAYAMHASAGSLEEFRDGLGIALRGLMGERRWTEAEAILQRSLEVFPDRAWVWLQLAELSKGQGKWDECESRLRQSFSLSHSEEARLQLGTLLRDRGYAWLLRGERERALPMFQEVIALAPEGLSLEGMEAVLESNSSATQGTRHSESDRMQDPGLARDSFEQAVELYRQGKVAEARDQFRESVQHLSANPLAYLHWGRLELELDRAAAAEEPLRLALQVGQEMGMDVEHGFLLLLRSLMGQEREQQARELLDVYRQEHPEGAYLEQMEALLP